jgi:hypothetical protein
MSLHRKDWMKIIGGLMLAMTGAGLAGVGPMAAMMGTSGGAGAAGAGAAGATAAGTGATVAPVVAGGAVKAAAAPTIADLLTTSAVKGAGTTMGSMGTGMAVGAMTPQEQLTTPGQGVQAPTMMDIMSMFPQKTKKGFLQ